MSCVLDLGKSESRNRTENACSQGVFGRGARVQSLTNGKEWVTYVDVQVCTASCHAWQGINYLIINHIGII